MSNPNVLVLGSLDDSAARTLAECAEFVELPRQQALDENSLIEHLTDKDAVISEPLDMMSINLMDQCGRLRMISNRAVGFDNVDLDEATRRGILVTNTPGVLDDATADLAFALLLATARRVVEADRFVRNGNWTGFRSDLMLGPDISGKICGIIGMGRIGMAFARRARAFGLKIIYTRLSRDDDKDRLLGEELGAVRTSLDQLVSTSDFISIHCPLTPQTRHLISTEQLRQMKSQCVLINTARGPIIDQAALISCLKEGGLFGAGLDVFEDEPDVPDELKQFDNVVLTPHIASACTETRRRMTSKAVDAIVDAFRGARPEHLVNPEAWSRFEVMRGQLTPDG